MISSLKSVMGSCGAYIGAIAERQAIRPDAPDRPGSNQCLELRQIHKDEPSLKPTSRFHSPSQG
jgi:hypothetical protein